MLNIVISFDYELFMGQNFVSEDEVLIQPTDKLCKMLKAEGVSATFFADALCPVRYRELGLNQFPDSFDQQLQQLENYGHDVQLHIHPHWLKATKVGRNVVFDRQYYRIHNWILPNGDTTPIKDLINKGKKYLENVLLPVNNEYKCVAFRAGGYCLQPECLLAPILYSEGIKIDSSVCYGHEYNSDGMAYDYTKLPKKFNQYISDRYGLCDCVQEKPVRGIYEVPIWSYKAFPYRAIASRKNAAISSVRNGYGMAISQPKSIGIMERVKRIFTSFNMLTFDFFNADSMVYMINKISQEKTCRNKDVFISIIAHPKGQSDQHIKNMQQAISILKNNPNLSFVSMSQITKLKGL